MEHLNEARLQARAELLVAVMVGLMGLYLQVIRIIPYGWVVGDLLNMGIMAVAVFVLLFFIATHRDFLRSPYVMPFVVFTGLTVISGLLAPSSYLFENLKRSGMIFLSLLVLATFYRTPKPELFKRYIKVLAPAAIAMFVICALGVLMFLFNFQYVFVINGEDYGIGFLRNTYLRGIWFDSNFAAMYTMSWIVLGFVALRMFSKAKAAGTCIVGPRADKFLRFAYRGAFVSSILFLPLANSRGSVLSLACALFVLGFMVDPGNTPLANQMRSKKVGKVIQAILFTLAGLALYYGMQYLFEWYQAIRWQLVGKNGGFFNFESMFNKAVSYDTSDLSSGRLTLWAQGLEEWSHVPLFGSSGAYFFDSARAHGIGAPTYYGIASGYYLHNSLIEVLGYYGLAGLAAVFVIIFQFIVNGFKNARTHGSNPLFYVPVYGVGFLFAATCFLSSAWVTIDYTQWLMMIMFSFVTCITSPDFKDVVRVYPLEDSNDVATDGQPALKDELVSVIVPVYNSEKTVAQTVESLLGQTHGRLEVILVNDGSTDGSPALVDALRQGDASGRVRVIHQENKGLSGARNAGIDASSGAWLSFIDADDIVAPTFIETLLNAARLTGCPVARCEAVTSPNPTCALFDTQKPVGAMVNTWQEEALLQFTSAAAIMSCNKLYAREVLGDLRFPVGKLHEDEYLVPTLVMKAGTVAVCDAALYGYRVDPASTSITTVYSPRRFHAAQAFLDRSETYSAVGEQALADRCLWSAYLTAVFHLAKAPAFIAENDGAPEKAAQAQETLAAAQELEKSLYPKLKNAKGLGLQRKIRLAFAHANPQAYQKVFG